MDYPIPATTWDLFDIDRTDAITDAVPGSGHEIGGTGNDCTGTPDDPLDLLCIDKTNNFFRMTFTKSGDGIAHTLPGVLDLEGTPFIVGNPNNPNVVTLTDVTAQSPRQWLPVALAVVALAVLGGAMIALRRRRLS